MQNFNTYKEMIKALTSLHAPGIMQEEGLHIAYNTVQDFFVVIDLTQAFTYYGRSVLFAMTESGYRDVISFHNLPGTYTINPNENYVLFKRKHLSKESMEELDKIYDKIQAEIKENFATYIIVFVEADV